MGRKRPLAPIDIESLKREIGEVGDKQLRTKLCAIHLYELGNTADHVSSVFFVTAKSVLNWRSLYCLEGVQGLKRKEGAGRPPKLPEAVRNDLADAADLKNPKEFGYQTAVWTLPLLKDWLYKTHGCVLSTSAIAVILKKKAFATRRRSSS
jgi:transposase